MIAIKDTIDYGVEKVNKLFTPGKSRDEKIKEKLEKFQIKEEVVSGLQINVDNCERLDLDFFNENEDGLKQVLMRSPLRSTRYNVAIKANVLPEYEDEESQVPVV